MFDYLEPSGKRIFHRTKGIWKKMSACEHDSKDEDRVLETITESEEDHEAKGGVLLLRRVSGNSDSALEA